MDDPTPSVSERLAAERQKIFDLQVETARLEVQLELEEAKLVAHRAAHENQRLRDRNAELERALGRRRRAREDADLGIARLRILGDMRRNRNGGSE